MTLLRELPGRFFAVDLYRPYLDELHRKALEAGLAHRLAVIEADMARLPFPEGSFDLIWSEGAIYNVGFRRGLELWRPLLRLRGCLAVTDAVYLVPQPDREVRTFWNENYPTMTTVEENLKEIAAAGYRLLGHFVLPQGDWENYYGPLEARLEALAAGHEGDEGMEAVIAMEREEIALWKRWGGQYGYAFFVMTREESEPKGGGR